MKLLGVSALTSVAIVVLLAGSAWAVSSELTPPQPPRAPGSLGLSAPPSAAATASVREAATGMLTKYFGLSEAQAERNLDLQARAGDLGGELLARMGRGLSQVSFDNEAGRYSVRLSPSGDAAQARQVLDSRGLANSEAVIERADTDYIEHQQLAESIAKRVLEVTRAGHASVVTVAGGVEITLAAGASADEQEIVNEVAQSQNVFVKRDTRNDLRPTPAACGAYGTNRYCDAVRGGSRWWEPNAGCSLGWWAGPSDPPYPYFLTAGHCITPGGAAWWTCNAALTSCPFVGGEYGQRWGPGGDNGLLGVTNGAWAREAGFTDWRDGSRQPITYLPGYWDYNQLAGTTVCHGGSTTGWSCGALQGVTPPYPTGDPPGPNPAVWLDSMIRVEWICMQSGDSGGPVFTADLRGAVGVTSTTEGCNVAGEFEGIKRMHDTYGLLPYGG